MCIQKYDKAKKVKYGGWYRKEIDMKGNVYWWIEKEIGKLVKQGRYFYQGTIYDGGTPNLFRTKK